MKRIPSVAAALSIIPGLGHFYSGYPKKAVTLFIIDVGIFCMFVFSAWQLFRILAIFLYLISFFASAMECYFAKAQPKFYVVLLLLTTGFSALPLLWQDSRFSKR